MPGQFASSLLSLARNDKGASSVITSYSIHYTKLYEARFREGAGQPLRFKELEGGGDFPVIEAAEDVGLVAEKIDEHAPRGGSYNFV